MDLDISQIDLKQEAAGKEKIYFAIILLLIVVTFARWFYIPKVKEIKLLKVEVKNASLQIDTLKQFANLKLPTLQTQPQNHNQQIKSGTKFEKAIEESMKSQQQVVADIVRQLTSQNVLNNVSISGMSFGSEVDKGGYGLIPVSIDVDGRYAGILGYLEHIETFGKLITVDNVELTTDAKSPTYVKAKLNMNIYVVHTGGPGQQAGQPAGQPAPAGGQAVPQQGK